MYSDREQLPCFARGLAWLASARHFGIRLHDHHVCAHSPTVLTNPELSEVVAECILCVLQVRTQCEKYSSGSLYTLHVLVVELVCLLSTLALHIHMGCPCAE